MSVKWGGCFFTLLLILTGLGSVRAEISDLRRCADQECKEPISKGRTMIGYPSNDEQILSFPINAEVTVYSKEAGSRQDLWGAEIKGKRGYVPRQYIREHKVFVKKLEYVVPTEGSVHDNKDSALDTKKADGKESHEDSSTEPVATDPAATDPAATESQTEPQVEEIALSAEDVEYNNLKKAALDKQEKDLHKDDVKIEEGKYDKTMQGNAEEEELQDDDDDGEEEEADAEFEEEEEDGGEEPVEVTPVDIETDHPEVQPSVGMEVSDKSKDNEGKDAALDAETDTESAEIPATSDIPIDAVPSPANYEVIDGTTLYFDDATPLPPTAEVLAPVNLMSSSVSDQEYVTAHPPPILSQGVYEDSHDQNANIEVTSTLNPETSSTMIMGSGSESVVTEAPVEPTETLPSEKESLVSTEVEGAKPSIDPSSSWLSDATSSITSWFGSEDEETDEKKSDGDVKESESPISDDNNADESDGFGMPKIDSVIDGAEITGEDDAQNSGFFSSWFGSTEAPKVQGHHDESSEHSGTTKSDEAVTEEADIEPNRESEDSSTDASKADPVDTLVPSDTIQTPVEATENPEVFAQPPYTSDDVDNAYNTQHTPLPSVDAIPETPATPDLDQNPENPLDHDEMVSSQDPSRDLSTMALKDQVDLTDNTDDDEDPGTSTARPMYAVPDPASQDFRSNNHVDPDDLSHLAGKRAVMDGAESSDSEGADVSLSEGLLKTSHNLLPEGLAFGFEAELAEPQVSNGMLVFMLIVSGTVVSIYFVHLVMMRISREGPLLEALNRIDHENRVKADENTSLQEELSKARADLQSVASRVTTSSGDVDEISSQLEMVKNEYASEKGQLEERIVQLEHELEEATTNGLEMHKMLSEMLSSQKDASAFQASVDHLQAMLDGQREKVETLTSDLALKNRLNEELHSELSASMERASKLDYQVEQLTHSLEELTGVKGEEIRKLQEEAAVVEELKHANVALTKQTGEYDSKVTSLTDELSDLRDTINQLRESVETKESELQVAKECLKQLRLTSSDDNAAPDEEKLSALFDVIRVKAELHKVSNERLTLVEQLQDAEMAQKNLEETMASIRTEVSELRTHHDVAIREKQEAMSKLEVLTKYFEEKEAQLTKELESQEGLRVNAEGSAAAVARKIQNYDLELASYKKIKKQSAFSDSKPKRHYQVSQEVLNLSDLSPTTANVSMSDEYKVEWVKAKAEMKRRKSSASSTDKSDKASSSTASGVISSTGSSRHSTDSVACPSDSSLNTGDSPIRPQRRKDSIDLPKSKTMLSHSADLVTSADMSLSETVSFTDILTSSPLRPSSLTVITRSHPVSVVYSGSRPSVFHRTVSPIDKPEASGDDLSTALPKTEDGAATAVVTEDSNVLERKLTIPSLCLDDDVSESVKQSPASDDFKSSVAAIRSFYESKKGILLSKSGTQPGYRLRTQVESLRKELEEQESSYKSQISSHEQKAHENWLQARAAERKHEEQRQENSQLRSRLTMMQKEREEVQQSQVNIIKPTPKRVDANGTMSSPRPMVDGVDGDHSGPPSLHRDLDSPPIPPPHPMHGPPMLPMMFPPGGPLPPGVPPPHGLPPGVPPPPGLPHGVPPHHGLPPHPFLPGEPPFMGPLPPLPGDRRLPPAGGMSSPPFRRSGSPTYDHRNDRYSPLSDRSHISDRRYSPPPLRRRPLSPDMHRNRSPDRRSDRTRSPDRRSERMMRSPDHRNDRRSPDRRSDRRSPDRHYNRSPEGYMRHRNSPRNYYDEQDFNNDDSRLRSHHMKGKKTSTPLGPNDR